MTVSSSGLASAILDPLNSPNSTDVSNRWFNSVVFATVGGITGRSEIFTQHAGDSWTRYTSPQYNGNYNGIAQGLNVVVGSRVSLGQGMNVNVTGGGVNGFPLQSLCDWESSDTTKATVEDALGTWGRVTAVAPGTVTFTCNIAGNGSWTASTQSGWQSPGNYIALNIVAATTSAGVDWYVRNDGGTLYTSSNTSGQCNGQANAAYPGSGVNQACAVKQYYYLWSPTQWYISGGDRVHIRPDQDWIDGYGSDGNCGGASNYTCTSPSIPSGSPSHHTQILGTNAGSCHAESAKTTLTGIYGSKGFNITDSQFVDVSCIRLTDHAQCTENGNYTHNCTSTDAEMSVGIVAESLSSVNLTDVSADGLANDAWNGPSGPDDTWNYGLISGMPFAGISMDNSPWQSSNLGAAGGFTMNHVTTEFSGCVKEYPVAHNYPFIECRDATSGGYADGFGTASTIGDWNFDHDVWRYNYQDGLDLLHSEMNIFSVTNSQSYGNEGQQYKIGSGHTVTFFNNFAVNNCKRIESLFGDQPAGSIATGVSGCRRTGMESSSPFL